MELTDPFEAEDVAVAHRAELACPKRTSLPSILPPGMLKLAVWSIPSPAIARLPFSSDRTATANMATKMMVMAASRAQPLRVSPTILPNV